MSDIPVTHPRYKSLVIRKQLADYALAGVVSLEGLTSHGRGEARILLAAKHPVLSINGNTAALAAAEIADLQKAAGCEVEVNLFHRTEERIRKVTDVLTVDLNPLDRTSKTATIPIIDEVTRALPNIAAECRRIKAAGETPEMPASFDGKYFLKGAVDAISETLTHALD